MRACLKWMSSLLFVSVTCFMFCGQREELKPIDNMRDPTPVSAKTKLQTPPTKKPDATKVTRNSREADTVRSLFQGLPQYPGVEIEKFSRAAPDYSSQRKGSTNSIVYSSYDMFDEICTFYDSELAKFNPVVMSVPTGRGNQKMFTFILGNRNFSIMILNDEEENLVRIMYSMSGEE